MAKLTSNLPKILFVDDDASLANAFKRLHRDRYKIYLAESGADALELMIGNNDFSVIIADFNMPKMDGIRFLQRAREKSPDAITIMLTGNANLDLAIQALHKGEIYRFLTKPCAPEVLEKAIDNAIEKFGINELKNKLARTGEELEKANKELNARMLELQQVHGQLIVEYEKNEAETQMAKEVFDRLVFSHNNDCDYMKTWSSPMSVFSGDLSLSARSQNNHFYAMLADFTGHGLPAAIGAPLAADIFVRMAESGAALTDIVAALNKALCTVLPVHLFCAAGLIEFDTDLNKLTVWNGGLPDILVTCNDGSILSAIESAHFPLGIKEYDSLDLESTVIEPEQNSTVFLYSDGLTDAMNSAGERYGVERLKKHFYQGNPINIFNTVKVDTEKFIGDAKQEDDITIINVLLNAAGIAAATKPHTSIAAA